MVAAEAPRGPTLTRWQEARRRRKRIVARLDGALFLVVGVAALIYFAALAVMVAPMLFR